MKEITDQETLDFLKQAAENLPVVKLPDYVPSEDTHVSPPAVKHKPIDPALLPPVSEEIEKLSKEFANVAANRVAGDNIQYDYA